jgi:hypothetical protein
MTNEQAQAKHAAYPHLSLATIAYTQGRNSVDDAGKVWGCEFTSPELVAEWKAGVRSMKSEIRLNNDTEWD